MDGKSKNLQSRATLETKVSNVRIVEEVKRGIQRAEKDGSGGSQGPGDHRIGWRSGADALIT